MVRDQEELPVLQPRVVLVHDVGQFPLAPRVGVAVEDRVQHGHEVALAGSERAVQVGGAGGAGLHRGPDQAQGPVEVDGQRVGDHVAGDRGLLADPLGEGEDEVAGVHLVGDGDEVPQQHLVAHATLPGRSPPITRDTLNRPS